MKNNVLYILGILVFFISSCKNEIEKPKVSYDKNSKKELVQNVDTNKIEVSDLPIQFTGTNYLIFPIGNLSVTDNSKSRYEWSGKGSNQSFNISNNMDNEITGYLQNLKFQNIEKDTMITLTNKPMLIQSVTYLNSISSKIPQQILLYILADTDSNSDGKLDTNDIRSLYLSDISGSRFTKISAELQEVLDWKIIDSKNRLYFRVIDDTNKNGKFDKDDKVHYNLVNLLEKEWKVIEFKPV